MTFGLGTDLQSLPATRELRENAILQEELIEETDGALDGCVSRVDGFLRELIEMSGQDIEEDMPVLELQLGDIRTRTSLQTTGKSFLLIIAYLPKCRRSLYIPRPQDEAELMAPPTGAIDFIWHADEGRYMGVRRIPTTDLLEERNVMDAILDTADQASSWFTSLRANKQSVS